VQVKLPFFSSAGKGFWETVRNIGWLSAGRLIKMGGGLVIGTMMVRYLGPTQFGIYSYAFAIYGMFNMVSNLGLDMLVVSEVALTKEQKTLEELLGTSFLLKTLASVVTTVAAITYTSISHSNDHATTVLVSMFSICAISQGFDVVDYFFQARTQSRHTILPQMIVFVVGNIARLIAILSKASLITFGVIAALEILFNECGLAITYFRRMRDMHRWRFVRAKGIALLQMSWPLLIASLLINLYMRTDQIILGSLMPKSVVGEYASATKLSELWYIIPSLICSSVMPRLLSAKSEDSDRYYHRLQKLYDLMVVVSIVIAIGTTVLGKYAILLLFGNAYRGAIPILNVHIWTGVFVFIGVVSGTQLVHENLTRLSLSRSVVGAIMNIILNYMLIPRFGGVGSACATLITQATSAYFMDAVNPKTRHIFRMKTRALMGNAIWTFLRKPKEAVSI
jgi:PST family polysaccharide transporter